MYLLPAGVAPRTNTKLSGLRGSGMHYLRGLGLQTAMLMRTNGNGGSTPTRVVRTTIPPPVVKTSPIVFAPEVPKPVSTTKTTLPIMLPLPIESPIVAPKPQPIFYATPLPPPIVYRPPVATPTQLPMPTPAPPILNVPPTPATAGTPVPPNFPTNQFYVATDGSVWEFSSGKWFNAGKPYSPPATTPPAQLPSASSASSPVPNGYPTSSAYTDANGNIWTYTGGQWSISGSVNTGGAITASSPSSPVNVTVSPTSDSGYQTILDWLTQQTLIAGVPNWIIGGGVAFIGWKLFKGGR